MKTLNNILRSFALLTAVIFLNAVNPVFADNSKPTGTPGEESNTTDWLAAEPEEALAIEAWMSDTDYWQTPEPESFMIPETEEEMVIENWMSQPDYWASSTNQLLQAETEKDMAIEGWMSAPDYWLNTQSAKEKDMAIESWMSDEQYWTK